MPVRATLGSATQLVVTVTWVAGAVVGVYLLGVAVSWILQRVGARSAMISDLARFTRRPFRATMVVIAGKIALDSTTPDSSSWRVWVDHLLLIVVIAAITWLFASFVRVAERRAVARFAGGVAEVADADLQRRRIRTQVTTLRRLGIAIVVVFGTAAALMTFPGFKQVGTTLFASAGVISLVAGLAAQTSLGLVFAGMQVSFSGAMRVGDVVVLEGEWGRIEEITLTYVVVRIWDERRLVLPTTYFTTTPFQNWTRNATELLGTVELDVDFTVPIDPMRAELTRLVSENDLWDGRNAAIHVTDALGGYLRVRILVSAPNAGDLFSLRCAVREGIVDWLQRTHPNGLPRWRVDQPSAGTVADDSGGVGTDGRPVTTGS